MALHQADSLYLYLSLSLSLSFSFLSRLHTRLLKDGKLGGEALGVVCDGADEAGAIAVTV